jgi:hypothetical protein
MRVNHAFDRVIEAEQALAAGLERLAGRHAAEHDIYQLGRTQATKAAQRAQRLEEAAREYGAGVPDPDLPREGMVDALRREASQLMGRSSATGLLLLDDLQETYLATQRAEIAWTVLMQAAKARRDAELVSTVSSAHEECEVTAKWLRTRIKVAAPQILAVG